MARPKKTGMDYFPHDCNASTDEKLERFELRHPNGAGYAWYFKALERIYRNGGELVSSLETTLLLSRNIKETPNSLLEDALEIGLFDIKEYEARGVLTSESIKRRVIPIFANREYQANYYEKRVSNLETTLENTYETPLTDPQIKEKETKQKEIKLNKNKDRAFLKPTIEEVKAYCLERGNSVDPERWFSHYESNGWKVGRSSMKDWRAAVRTWERNEFNSRTAGNKSFGYKPLTKEILESQALAIMGDKK